MDAIILCDGGVSGGARALLPRAKAARVPVMTDLDLFSSTIESIPRRERPKVVGVTGAAGKSVTATLIAKVVEASGGTAVLGGGTGGPCLSLPAPKAGMTYIMELPVARLAAARRFRCDVSVMLSLGQSGETDGLDAALRAVMRLFRQHQSGDAAVIGVDDGIGLKVCTALQAGDAAKVGAARVIPVSGEASLGHGVFALEGFAYTSQDGKTQAVGDFTRVGALSGKHLNQDAAAAIAASLALDVAPPLIIKALHRFKGLEGRFEVLGSEKSILFVDDSRSRLPASVSLAIDSCPDVFWIGAAAGGGLKGAHPTLQGCYLIGPGEMPSGISMPCARYPGLADALDAARRDAAALVDREPHRAPVILYSPGAMANPREFRTLLNDGLEKAAQHG